MSSCGSRSEFSIDTGEEEDKSLKSFSHEIIFGGPTKEFDNDLLKNMDHGDFVEEVEEVQSSSATGEGPAKSLESFSHENIVKGSANDIHKLVDLKLSEQSQLMEDSGFYGQVENEKLQKQPKSVQDASKNPYFNFLKDFRLYYNNVFRGRDLVRQAARRWNNMPKSKRYLYKQDVYSLVRNAQDFSESNDSDSYYNIVFFSDNDSLDISTDEYEDEVANPTPSCSLKDCPMCKPKTQRKRKSCKPKLKKKRGCKPKPRARKPKPKRKKASCRPKKPKCAKRKPRCPKRC